MELTLNLGSLHGYNAGGVRLLPRLDYARPVKFPPCLPLALRRLRAALPETATSEISATGRLAPPAILHLF